MGNYLDQLKGQKAELELQISKSETINQKSKLGKQLNKVNKAIKNVVHSKSYKTSNMGQIAKKATKEAIKAAKKVNRAIKREQKVQKQLKKLKELKAKLDKIGDKNTPGKIKQKGSLNRRINKEQIKLAKKMANTKRFQKALKKLNIEQLNGEFLEDGSDDTKHFVAGLDALGITEDDLVMCGCNSESALDRFYRALYSPKTLTEDFFYNGSKATGAKERHNIGRIAKQHTRSKSSMLNIISGFFQAEKVGGEQYNKYIEKYAATED